jgi:hypothetical protein
MGEGLFRMKDSQMSDTTTRANRAEEIRQERRKKPGSTVHSGTKLVVDERKLDRANFTYRWVKDYGGRMAQLHGEDYDPAPENAVIGSEGVGTVGAKTGGTDEFGKPYQMVLMRKRKDWFDVDQREKQKPLDEMDRAIRAGRPHSGTELTGEGVYTPDGGNRIG